MKDWIALAGGAVALGFALSSFRRWLEEKRTERRLRADGWTKTGSWRWEKSS